MSKDTKKIPNCKCSMCDKPIYRRKSDIKRSKNKRFYCGRVCESKFKFILQEKSIVERTGIEDFKGFLQQKYWDEELPTSEIAEIIYGRKSMNPNIVRWMDNYGIPRRIHADSVSLQWKGNKSRKKEQGKTIKKVMASGTPGRIKLIRKMKTDEYRKKAANAKLREKNPMWKPDLSEEEREKQKYHSRRYEGYKDFRRKVYERDNYTCQICHDCSGGNLVVHHLNGFHWDVKNRTEVDNGVTLCNECHKNFHSLYGSSHNNLFQFSQFKDYKVSST